MSQEILQGVLIVEFKLSHLTALVSMALMLSRTRHVDNRGPFYHSGVGQVMLDELKIDDLSSELINN